MINIIGIIVGLAAVAGVAAFVSYAQKHANTDD